MSFLAALVGMARGEPPVGAARPILPPRFGRALPMTDAAFATEPPPAADRRDTAPAPAVARGIPDRAPEPVRADRPAHGPSPPPARSTTNQGASAAPDAATGAPMRTAAMPIVPPPAFVGPAPVLAIPTGRDAPHPLPPESSPATPPGPPPRSAASIGRAPLGQNAIAERVTVAREPRPVIHVAIDRIDVRAPAGPAAPAPAPAPRTRHRPTRSLADYLATAGDGARE